MWLPYLKIWAVGLPILLILCRYQQSEISIYQYLFIDISINCIVTVNCQVQVVSQHKNWKFLRIVMKWCIFNKYFIFRGCFFILLIFFYAMYIVTLTLILCEFMGDFVNIMCGLYCAISKLFDCAFLISYFQ